MIWNHTDASTLTMKQLNLDEIKLYLSKIKDKELFAYGVYQIEAGGRFLFSKIEGDEDAIMGLPVKQIKGVFKPIEMKKYLVIGNPIKHSLSPKLHNHWIRQNNIDAVYEKNLVIGNNEEANIQGIISEIKNGKIEGINVTVPFKKSVIPF